MRGWNRWIVAWLALALVVALLSGCTITRPESMLCTLECDDCKRVVLRCEEVIDGGVEIAPRSALVL